MEIAEPSFAVRKIRRRGVFVAAKSRRDGISEGSRVQHRTKASQEESKPDIRIVLSKSTIDSSINIVT